MVFVESSEFQRQRDRHLSADGFRQLQNEILAHPSKGALIRGSGGLRKIRFGAGGKGKSGGIRVIYYHVASLAVVYLLDLYAKSEQADLSPRQLKDIRERLNG